MAGGSGALAPHAQALLVQKRPVVLAVCYKDTVFSTAQLLASASKLTRTSSWRRGRARKASVCVCAVYVRLQKGCACICYCWRESCSRPGCWFALRSRVAEAAAWSAAPPAARVLGEPCLGPCADHCPRLSARPPAMLPLTSTSAAAAQAACPWNAWRTLCARWSARRPRGSSCRRCWCWTAPSTKAPRPRRRWPTRWPLPPVRALPRVAGLHRPRIPEAGAQQPL